MAEYARAIQELEEEIRIQAMVGFIGEMYTEKELGWLFLEGMDEKLRNETVQQGLKEYFTVELPYSSILGLLKNKKTMDEYKQLHSQRRKNLKYIDIYIYRWKSNIDFLRV